MKILDKIYAMLPMLNGKAGAQGPCEAWLASEIQAARTCHTADELAVFCRHRSGHVREAALHRAGELSLPASAPAVAARLNDWVALIRQLARQVLLELLPLLEPDEALALLPAVQQLRHAKRADHTDWLAGFERAFIAAVGAGRIVDAVIHPVPSVARACHRLVEAHGLAGQEAVLARILAHSNDIVLLRAAVEAVEGLPVSARTSSYRLALDSSSGAVRAIALRHLLSHDSVANDALAAERLVDLDAWVRSVAAGYLARRHIDPAAILAARLVAADATHRVLRACLMGLAGLRSSDRLDLVHRFTGHGAARVQIAAFLAWLYLAPFDKDTIAQALLRSRFYRVRKLSLVLEREHGAYVAMDEALALLHAHGDIALMLAFSRTEAWSWLQVIAELALRADGDVALRERLKVELAAWIVMPQKLHPGPTAAQRAMLRRDSSVAALRALIGPGHYRRLLDLELASL